jgi:hypothetical protein
MRNARLFIAAVALVACSKSESAKPDSAAAAAAAAPSAPAAVTAADMAAPVSGKVMAQGSDSVLTTFTCTAGTAPNTSKCVDAASPKDTINYTYTLSGADSVMFESAPFTPARPPKSPKVVNHVVGHLSGNKWTGTATQVLAAKPDSVVARLRWEGTKGQ